MEVLALAQSAQQRCAGTCMRCFWLLVRACTSMACEAKCPNPAGNHRIISFLWGTGTAWPSVPALCCTRESTDILQYLLSVPNMATHLGCCNPAALSKLCPCLAKSFPKQAGFMKIFGLNFCYGVGLQWCQLCLNVIKRALKSNAGLSSGGQGV